MTTNQARLDLPCPIAAQADPLGFEIGFDHARLGIEPTDRGVVGTDAIAQGWQAGRAVFGHRSTGTTQAQRCWIELRAAAWRAGRPIARLAVTPVDLQQITGSDCIVTGRPFTASGADAATACNLRPSEAPAIGRLVVLSRTAADALPELADLTATSPGALLRRVRDVDTGRHRAPVGLDASSLWRLGTLVATAHPMPHADAAAWPLRVMPTPRLQLANAVHRLQWLVTRAFATPGWSRRLRDWAGLIADPALRNDFQLFVGAFAPRVLEAGAATSSSAAQQMLGVAWADARVQRRWQHFASQLGDAGTRALLERAMGRGLLHPAGGAASRPAAPRRASAASGPAGRAAPCVSASTVTPASSFDQPATGRRRRRGTAAPLPMSLDAASFELAA